ncbi:MAG: hypothetical protein JSS84_12140 [Bacteroidetes bacterium]|nr:hypothetical protein [Bacteroidota bacterium]
MATNRKIRIIGGGALTLLLLAAPLFAAAAPTLNVSLTRSNYHGYGVSCFGMKDGTLQAAVTGGTAPYHYKWSNGASTATVDHLAAGYYRLDVIDANNEVATAEITLEQPLPMKLDVDVYEYSNGYNISCFQCNNGNAAVVVMGGAAPFTVSWSDGPVGANRYNLGPKDYKITVADANGCEGANTTIYLRGPAPSNWGMAGNANTIPGAQFMGTTDNKDVVFKSNGQERLRLKADGQIGLMGAETAFGPLYRDTDGTLKIGGGPVLPDAPGSPCFLLPSMPYWQTKGNNFSHLCPQEPAPLLGTLSNDPVKFATNGSERMRLTEDGNFGIGTVAPQANFHLVGSLLVQGANGDLASSSSATTGPVLWARNNLAAFGLSIAPNGKGHILGDWNNPHPIMTFAYDKVGIGTEDMPNDDYSLFVAKGILTEKVKVALRNTSEWSDHVFQPNYRLMPLKEVDAFIKEHGHLPGVPSAAQLVESGLDVVKTDAMLMAKVEELTLHLIQMEKRVAEVEKENIALRQQLRNR